MTTPRKEAVTDKPELVDELEDQVILDNKLDGVWHKSRKNKRAVVFVHGFTGEKYETWTDRKSFSRFDSLIAGDPELVDYDVFTFGYETTFWSGSRIEILAKELRLGVDALVSKARGRGRDYSLVLLAHSMGGLVCMRYLVDCLKENDIPPVIGLILYGTPTTGTGLVTIAKLVATALGYKVSLLGAVTKYWRKRQQQLDDLETASQFITGLHDQWNLRLVNGGNPRAGTGRMWLPVRVVTATKDQFVSEASAKGVYGAIDWKSLNYGHRELVKPVSTSDDRYYVCKSFLESCRVANLPSVESRVWVLSQGVWQKHAGRLISDLDYQTMIHYQPPDAKPLPTAFQDVGLSPCLVYCSYKGVLPIGLPRVGISFGRIGSDEVWNASPPPELVHLVGLDLIREEEQEAVKKVLDQVMAMGPEAAWDAFFPTFSWRINRVALQKGEVERGPIPPFEWLRRQFALPEELVLLVGEEVRFEFTYQSLVPISLPLFRLRHRWLTQGSTCRVTVNGEVDYFVSAQRLAVGQKATETIGEGGNSVKFETEDTVLPDSSFEVSWHLKDTKIPTRK